MALRGHASIQGSTDIPTLYDLLPGYLPMPRAREARPRRSRTTSSRAARRRGWWSNFPDYIVWLLKAWFGDAATAENEYGFGYLPKHQRRPLAFPDLAARCATAASRAVRDGPEPGRRRAATRGLQRRALAKLEWLVVRDLVETETASFWKDSPEVQSGELRTEDIETEVFLMPAAAHVGEGGHLHQHPAAAAVARQGARPAGRRPLASSGSCTTSAKRVQGALRRLRRAERDWPIRNLTLGLPRARARTRARRRGGAARDQRLRRRRPASRCPASASSRTTARPPAAAGSTAASIADGGQPGAPARARRPATPRAAGCRPSGGGRGRPTAACSTTAPPPTRRASRGRSASGTSGGTRRRASWTGYDVPDFPVDKPPDYRAAATTRKGMDAISGDDPFIMMADGRGWLFAPDRPARRAAADPLRADRVAGRATRSTPSVGANPAAIRWQRAENPLQRDRRPALPVRRARRSGSPSTTRPAR